MKKEITIVSIPFTGLGLFGGYRGDDWFKYRINIFQKYTLKSLLNQTDKNFIIWCQFRPEEKNNPLLKEIKIPHKHLFTFGGITIWDDKKDYEKDTLLERLSASLPRLREVVGENNVKLFNLASDDMYARDVIEMGNREEFDKEGTLLLFREGYIYDVEKDRLALWQPKTSPPFYCIFYENETFLNPEKHYNFIKEYKSHEYLPEVFSEKTMPAGKYCVLVHKGNISTIFNHPFRGEEIYDELTKCLVLENFGVVKKNLNKSYKKYIGVKSTYYYEQ